MTVAVAAEAFAAVVRERRAWLGWSGEPLADAEILPLLEEAHLAPSECNLQPWRFVVVRGAALERVCSAFLRSNRDKLREAGTVVAIFADEAAVGRSPEARAFYAASAFTERDFAMRNGALAGMVLLLGAQARGHAARPMVGFDVEALSRAVGAEPGWRPVMCVAVGRPGTPRHGERVRQPLEQVVRFL